MIEEIKEGIPARNSAKKTFTRPRQRNNVIIKKNFFDKKLFRENSKTFADWALNW